MCWNRAASPPWQFQKHVVSSLQDSIIHHLQASLSIGDADAEKTASDVRAHLDSKVGLETRT